VTRAPFMPWYIGDYLRDTQHLTTEQHGAYLLLIAHCWEHGAIPAEPTGRAQVVRLPLKRWQQIKAPIEAFFLEDGTHKRVTKELAKVERISVIRSIAASKRGDKNATANAQQKLSKSRAPPLAKAQQNHSKPTSKMAAKSEQLLPYQNQNQNLTSLTEQEAARASPDKPLQQQDKSAGSLATALDGSALTRPPDAAQDPPPSKPASEWTRDDFEKHFEATRAKETAAHEQRKRHIWGGSPPKQPTTETPGANEP
jgi:uncharacterized protein YdaU (DUF1376 family)